MLTFEMPKNQSSFIKVVGVGGGGGNAVNHMFHQGITGVDFIVCNTDAQVLDTSPVPNKIQLGEALTSGLGAGSKPDIGRQAAEESLQQISEALGTQTKMLFITAGMGGGTGTGAAPVLAKAAREADILTVGIVTIPFSFEGRKRRMQAEAGIEEMRKHVDTLLIVSNDKLREMHGNLPVSEAFGKADDILTVAAKGIAEIITVPGYINVDFEDIKTVMKDSGVAIMGTGVSQGENRAIEAIQFALQSPLLNDSEIKGASDVLLYISSGTAEIRMDEVDEITTYIQYAAGESADIIWGNGFDEALGDSIAITVIATGFKTKDAAYLSSTAKDEPVKIVNFLDNTTHAEPAKKPVAPRMYPPEENDGSMFDFEVKTIGEQPAQETEAETAASEPLVTEASNSPVRESPEQTPEHEGGTPQRLNPNRSEQRIHKLREMSMKLKTPGGLHEMESQPAYVRRNVALEDVPAADETEVSRYSLDDNGDGTGSISNGNSFLHDNVD